MMREGFLLGARGSPGGFNHLGSRPVAEPMRLESPCFSMRAACRGEICSKLSRVFSSSARLSPRPLADGASRFGGGLTRQHCYLTALVAAKLRLQPRTRSILQPLGQAQRYKAQSLAVLPSYPATGEQYPALSPNSASDLHFGLPLARCVLAALLAAHFDSVW
jgi:hypothetical protein